MIPQLPRHPHGRDAGDTLSGWFPPELSPDTVAIPAVIVAAFAAGLAIYCQDGEYTPLALSLITLAIIASIVAVGFSRFIGRLDASAKPAVLTLAAALFFQFIAMLVRWPAGVDQPEPYRGPANHVLYLALLAACGSLAFMGCINWPRARRLWFPALLVAHLALCVWIIRSSPNPRIDVWVFEQQSPRALLAGKNPYAAEQVRFPDIYDSTLPRHQEVYGPGLSVDGRLRFGFPYPPLSLYCSTLGVKFTGDSRYAQALALTLAGLLIGYSAMGRLPKLAAALLLFTPEVLVILGRAWTEPFVVLFLAGTVFCAARRLRWLTPIAFGLFLASKQYLAFAAPLSFVLIDGFDWRCRASWRAWGIFLLATGLIAAAVTLPLALRNWHAFWFSTVTVQSAAPFRWDALSYLTWIGFNVDSKYTQWIWPAFAMAAIALFLTLRTIRRSPAGFSLGLAAVYLPFIAFNKQAFCNYYFFVIACLCCALAAMACGRQGVRKHGKENL
ncbi:MAG TPA: hypothetical protein VFC78_18620 [Tepidisphaeraceae bacterium]|nr:hypothetical protein [Tepidisphaeraceae bacterium]